MIRILAAVVALICAAPRNRTAASCQSRQAECDRHRYHQGPHRLQAAHRSFAKARRADQAVGARGYYNNVPFSPRDGWLHGADRRRPEFQWHRRFEVSQPESGIFRRAVQARYRRHGAARRQRRYRELAVLFMFAEGSSLKRPVHTVIGEVVSGMDVVDKLKKAPPGSRGREVTDPDKMVKVQVASDIK